MADAGEVTSSDGASTGRKVSFSPYQPRSAPNFENTGDLTLAEKKSQEESDAQAQPDDTVDVRVAQAFPGDFPVFRPSVQVSKYLWAMWGSPGSYYFSQVQFNPPNYPLFKGGTIPFHGDYIDIAPSPRFVQDPDGSWRFNDKTTDSQQFHLAWTDNRDVHPPVDNNWQLYNPPSSAQTLSQSRFYVSTDCSDARNTGARNQNIYTTCITSVMVAGSPGNNKPLGTLGTNPTTGDLIPRAFVIFVKTFGRKDKMAM